MTILGVTNSFTGPAEALELVGEDRCYAYSGVIPDASSGSAATTMVKFTSGNYIAVVECYVATNDTGDYNRFYEANMNGTTIYAIKFDGVPFKATAGGPLVVFVIPPYTEFEFKYGSSGNFESTLVMTGRVYRD